MILIEVRLFKTLPPIVIFELPFDNTIESSEIVSITPCYFSLIVRIEILVPTLKILSANILLICTSSNRDCHDCRLSVFVDYQFTHTYF